MHNCVIKRHFIIYKKSFLVIFKGNFEQRSLIKRDAELIANTSDAANDTVESIENDGDEDRTSFIDSKFDFDYTRVKSYLQENIDRFKTRLQRILVLRWYNNETSNETAVNEFQKNSPYETKFLIRLTRLSNETLNCLDVCILNFVSY